MSFITIQGESVTHFACRYQFSMAFNLKLVVIMIDNLTCWSFLILTTYKTPEMYGQSYVPIIV